MTRHRDTSLEAPPWRVRTKGDTTGQASGLFVHTAQAVGAVFPMGLDLREPCGSSPQQLLHGQKLRLRPLFHPHS